MIRLAAILLLSSAAPLWAQRGRPTPVPSGPPPPPPRVSAADAVGLLPEDRRGKEFPTRANPFAIPTAAPVVVDEPVINEDRPEDFLKTLPIQGIMLGAAPMVMLGDMIIRQNETVPQALVPYDGEIVVTKIERGFLDFLIKPNALVEGGPTEPYPWRMQVTLSAFDAVNSRYGAATPAPGKGSKGKTPKPGAHQRTPQKR